MQQMNVKMNKYKKQIKEINAASQSYKNLSVQSQKHDKLVIMPASL